MTMLENTDFGDVATELEKNQKIDDIQSNHPSGYTGSFLYDESDRVKVCVQSNRIVAKVFDDEEGNPVGITKSEDIDMEDIREASYSSAIVYPPNPDEPEHQRARETSEDLVEYVEDRTEYDVGTDSMINIRDRDIVGVRSGKDEHRSPMERFL
jgi:hypothetical protein